MASFMLRLFSMALFMALETVTSPWMAATFRATAGSLSVNDVGLGYWDQFRLLQSMTRVVVLYGHAVYRGLKMRSDIVCESLPNYFAGTTHSVDPMQKTKPTHASASGGGKGEVAHALGRKHLDLGIDLVISNRAFV